MSASSESSDPESQQPSEDTPLLREETLSSARSSRRMSRSYSAFQMGPEEEQEEENNGDGIGKWTIVQNDEVDTMSYDQNALLSWRILFSVQGTAMDNPSLWKLFVQMVLLAMCIAIATCIMMGKASIDVSKFAKLTTFLNTFVGLMLGFFLVLQMKRWFASVAAFMQLFDAVRSLQSQCCGLGVCREHTATIVRYGVLSAWILYYELLVKCQGAPADGMAEFIQEKRPGLFTAIEREKLSKVGEPSSCIWTWVSSLVGRMAQDGDIPPMASPTYGRILSLAQMAHGAIRNVKANVLVQSPFIYAHMLVTLVHVNNILNSISLGLSLGVTAAKLRTLGMVGPHVAGIAQDTSTTILISLSAPLLYQAILEVCVAVAQPFGHEDGLIPVPKMLTALEIDLMDSAELADSPPSWEKPVFKKVPQ